MQRIPHITFQGVEKTFDTPTRPLQILREVTTTIYHEERVAIVGPSGSGKSTLLSLIAGLDTSSRGDIVVDATHLRHLDEVSLAAYRNRTIGIIFQSFELILPFTVEENIAAPLDIAGRSDPARVEDLLGRVGLLERRSAYPQTLSGGEKQRVAIARALVNDPAIILADEPTGSLDRMTGYAVLELLLEEVAREHKTLVVITHDQEIAARMDRTLVLQDGILIET